MFQNINLNDDENEEIQEDNSRLKILLKGQITRQSIILYIIAFLASMVGFSGVLSPFGLAIVAASMSYRNANCYFMYCNNYRNRN